ncbi:MAG: MotA/TolQ/ExbB proton channel family protein [Gammaproteobacteria bacterium]
MKKQILLSSILLGLVAVTAAGQEAAPPPPPDPHAQLLRDVQRYGQQVRAENQQRLNEFMRERNRQQALLNNALAELAREDARSNRLKNQFDTNERQLEELSETLRIRVGDMGELFGVVRQVAGDSKGVVDDSLISAQFPDRGDVASRLAQIRGLPSISDLNDLRQLLLEEMVESGRVSRFRTDVAGADGRPFSTEVVRVGSFNAIVDDEFLKYTQKTRSLSILPRQPEGRYRSMAEDLFDAGPGDVVGMAIDPSRGALLNAIIDAPTAWERIQQGREVGFIIIFLGILGILISVERMMTLSGSGRKIHSQLKSATADPDNALGRILSVYHDNKDIDTETLELKLDEAILKETPKLEKRQGFIKILAAVAPLLGLLGTVTGMIETFQQITLFGTGDPKLMAGGISQALVTTMLGLFVAIPLVLLHSFVASKSKTLIEILEEQSAGLIAAHSEKSL